MIIINVFVLNLYANSLRHSEQHVIEGSHSVPDDKVITRIPRTLKYQKPIGAM